MIHNIIYYIHYKYGYIDVILCTFSIYTNIRYYCYVIYLVLFDINEFLSF